MVKLLKLLILICSFLYHIAANYISMDLSVDNSQINTQSSYTFAFSRDLNPLTSDFVTPSTVSIGSIIQIVFPNDYTDLTTTPTVPCTDMQTGLALTCQVSQITNTITIKNYYLNTSTTGNLYPSIKISSIINPAKSGSTQNFVYYIRDSSGNIIDQSPVASNTIYFPRLTFTAGSFQSCKLSAQGATILTRSKLYLSLTPKNQIPSSGKIYLEFPLAWSNDLQNSRTLITTPNCAAITGLSGTLSCSYTVMAAPVNKIYVTITGLSSTSITNAFSLSIQSILTPPYVDSGDTVTISSQWSDGSQIDRFTTTIADLTAIKFQSATFESSSNTIVQSSFNGLLSLSIAKPFSYLDTIVLTVPSNFINAIITSTGFSSFSQSKDASSSSITLSNFPSTSSKSTNTVLNFTLQGLVNPISVKPVTIIVSFYRLGSIYQQSNIDYAAVKGTATLFKINPTSSFVNVKGGAQSQIQTSLSIPAGTKIKLFYPATVTASDVAQSPVSSALLNGISMSSSSFMVSSNTVIFSNIFQATFVNGTVLIDFSSFQNPPTVQPSQYLLTVQTSQGFLIFTSSFTITATLKGLIRNQISASNYQVLSNSIITATIQLNYLATTVSIVIPSDILINTGFQTTCLPNNLTACYLKGSNLTFEGNFQPGVQIFSWGNTQNPNSFQPTQTFSFFTYNRGWGVQKSLGYIYLQMNQTSIFSSILAIPSLLKNNERISLALTINLPVNSPSQGQISVVFPSELDISLSSCSITCLRISNNITFDITTFTSKLEVQITNLLNSPSYKPNSNFNFYFINSNGYNSLAQTKTSWTNNIPSSFGGLVSTGDAYRGQNALFNFKLTGLSGKQTYVVIQFNDLFGALTTTPADGSLLGPRTVRLNIVNQTTSDLYLTLLTPTIFGDYTFSMETYIELSGISYLIGQSTSNNWQHSCFGTVCRQCDSTNKSKCINCYSNTISEYYIFDTLLNICRRDCTSGYFMTAGNICSPCSNNCLECTNVSTNCTSCDSTKSLFLDTNYKKCVLTCEDGYYQNSQIQQCRNCTPPCLYCQASATKCTYCIAGKFLLNQNCLSNCPTTGQYIQNSFTRKCDLCNTNCLTCQTTINTCSTCNTTLLLFLENKVCVSKCQNNSFIDFSAGKCITCQVPCNICFNDSNTCSTCLSNSSTPIWYNYKCINQTQCPIGNFVNKANYSCGLCPLSCASCNSNIACTACQPTYTLYQGQCLDNCPNTTYEDTRVCLACQGCNTCDGNYTNCTSCIPSQFLFKGLCYKICPDGTFPNNDLSVCQNCPSDCPTCKSATFCLTCLTDLFLYVGKCYHDCPISTFPSTLNSLKICQVCPQKCLQCSSLVSCQTCKTGYNLQNDTTCVTTCSKGIAFNQLCYPCGLNCANCNQTSEQCQLCDTSFLVYQGKCLNKCPSNTLSLNNINCVSCTIKFGQNCTTCQFGGCLSCSDGELTGGQCMPCAVGYYSRSSKCASCPSSCSSCINETFCTACASNFYMEGNNCVSSCPLNKVPNGTECSFCLSYCSICNLNNSLCSVCNSGYYLHQSRCVLECPSPLIINLDRTKCVTQQIFYQQYSKEAKVVYFPFSIAGILLIIIGIIIKCASNITHLITFSCAVVSIAQIGSWLTFAYIQFMAYENYHFQSLKGFALTVTGILLLITITIIHVKFYCKYLTTDTYFQKWEKNHFFLDKFFLSLSILLNFKIYRIVHSRLLERDQFSMKLITLNKLLPFSLLSIVSLVVCSVPVAVGTSLALYFSISQDQQFFAALDCLAVTSLMVILTLMDLRHQSTYFVIEVESSNLKRNIYEQDSFKISINGQNENPLDQKNVSKAQLLEQTKGEIAYDSAMKLRGQSQLLSTGFNQTKTQILTGPKQREQQGVEQIDINNQKLQFDDDFNQISEEGDQGVYRSQNSEKHLLDEQVETAPKWVQKKYDRNGYLLKTNEYGQQQRYDELGYKVVVGDDGIHRKFDKDGNQVQLFNGEFYVKEKDGFYSKNGVKYDKRGYEVRTAQNGELQFFDQDGFKVVQDEQGNIKLFDEHGFQIVRDEDGSIHRYTPQGYQVFISKTGKITYKDKQGNDIRINQEGQYEMYDPDDGFKIVINQNGIKQKYDKFGYRIEKDKWGNIYRYDKDGYRIVFGPGNKVSKFNKDGYEIITDQNGNIKLYNKEGYQVRIDENGDKKFYDQNGYEIIQDFDGNITLFDQNGYQVIIDAETGQHKKYTSEGLKVVQKNGKHHFYDKRGHQVVELQDGTYQKYDEVGNKLNLDQFGFQVQSDKNGQPIRFDKIGNLVDEDLFAQKFQEEQNRIQVEGQKAVKTIRRFKPNKDIDFQAQYSKMIENQNINEEQSLQQYPNLRQFHDPQTYKQYDFQQQLTDLKEQELRNQKISQGQNLNLDQLQQIDNNPQKKLKEQITTLKNVTRNGKYQQGNTIEDDINQEYIELKSIADASIDERSFINEGVQPIDAQDSQYSQLQSLDELAPNVGRKTKRKRGQHSQMSFMQGQNHDTKTEYNHKKVNVEIKNKNIYDQNEEIQSLNQENWAQNAQGGMFYNHTKQLSNANTKNTRNDLIFMDQQQGQNDALSNFLKQNSNRSHRQSPRSKPSRYQYDKNTIEEMQNQLFQKQLDQGIRQRTDFKLSSGPNPLVEYAKNMDSNKKSIQERIYLEDTRKKKKRR